MRQIVETIHCPESRSAHINLRGGEQEQLRFLYRSIERKCVDRTEALRQMRSLSQIGVYVLHLCSGASDMRYRRLSQGRLPNALRTNIEFQERLPRSVN